MWQLVARLGGDLELDAMGWWAIGIGGGGVA